MGGDSHAAPPLQDGAQERLEAQPAAPPVASGEGAKGGAEENPSWQPFATKNPAFEDLHYKVRHLSS
uniref:Uncharacterized protein n=1 Tax=Leersia perrieri TaxID=77586 RepID=A0A0D9XEQ1_9ORYZ